MIVGMLYDYQCKTCNHEFITEHSIKAEPLVRCPKCDKFSLQRMISNVSFVLKGDGWAKDLYSKNKGVK